MAWKPLTRIEAPTRLDETEDDEAWANDVYEVFVKYLEPPEGLDAPLGRAGALQLSIKRYDRKPIHDWRHFQQIKNEICGPEREAMEIYPSESRVIDTSNQYHLWVLPEGIEIPLGFPTGGVTTDEQTKAYNRARTHGLHGGAQRPWEPGLTTGRNEHTVHVTDEDYQQVLDALTRGSRG